MTFEDLSKLPDPSEDWNAWADTMRDIQLTMRRESRDHTLRLSLHIETSLDLRGADLDAVMDSPERLLVAAAALVLTGGDKTYERLPDDTAALDVLRLEWTPECMKAKA